MQPLYPGMQPGFPGMPGMPGMQPVHGMPGMQPMQPGIQPGMPWMSGMQPGIPGMPSSVPPPSGQRLFEHLDGKGSIRDGVLAWVEFAPLCQQIGWDANVAQQLWYQTDTDRSGTLSRQEFLRFCARPDVCPYLKPLEDKICGSFGLNTFPGMPGQAISGMPVMPGMPVIPGMPGQGVPPQQHHQPTQQGYPKQEQKRYGEAGHQLTSGRELVSNSAHSLLVSPNRRYHLVVQTDGNLVVYDGAPGSNPLWASNTNGKGQQPFRLSMQLDQHLCLYDGTNKCVWASGVYGKGQGAASAVLQDDGNFCVYDSTHKAMWCTRTNGPQKSPCFGKGEACM